LSQTEDNNNKKVISNRIFSSIFTDFEGRFKGRLGAVIPTKIFNSSENAPISANMTAG
jgi:hypothetical protein